MIYTSAIYANTDHTQVTGTDANGNTETVPANYTLFRQPEDGPLGFQAAGGVIEPYVAPDTSSAGANGAALEERQRKTAKDEAAALASAGDFKAAFDKLLELI